MKINAAQEEVLQLRTQLSTASRTFEQQLLIVQSEKNEEIAKLRAQVDVLQQELDRAHRMNEQALSRPTTINNNQNNQSIANVKITNFLADHNTYLAQTSHHRVREMLNRHLEHYFMDGQQGLARFVVEHIIKIGDNKLILCCTDPARKRFRFVNTDGKLAEDMYAKLLCNKLRLPIREMCNEVFDRIVDKLQEEKKLKISNGSGAFELDFLDKKIEWAGQKFIEIRAFEGDDNSDFLNELATLLRNASSSVDLE